MSERRSVFVVVPSCQGVIVLYYTSCCISIYIYVYTLHTSGVAFVLIFYSSLSLLRSKRQCGPGKMLGLLDISECHCYRYQCMSQKLWNWFHATKTETMDDESIQLFESTVIQLLPNSSAAHVWNVGVLIFCSSLVLNHEYIEIGAIIHCPTRQWRSGEVPSHCDVRGGCGT